jgi:hypothetical protein
MAWTEADDERVREFCKDKDVGQFTMCPKCGMGSQPDEMVLAHFCTHRYCPFRDHRLAKLATEHPELSEKQPRVSDDDKSEIKVTFRDRELRGWSYASEDERRTKMLAAREYVEGWCDGRDAQ